LRVLASPNVPAELAVEAVEKAVAGDAGWRERSPSAEFP